MKKYLILMTALTAALTFSMNTYAAKSVRGYTKKDGTYISPSHRTSPNKTQKDNYSSKPNHNPYTGKKGSKNAAKQAQQSAKPIDGQSDSFTKLNTNLNTKPNTQR